MKKKILISLFLSAGIIADAQSPYTVQYESDSTYLDMKVIPGNTHLAGLRYTSMGADVVVMQNNGGDLAHITGSTVLSLSHNIYEKIETAGNYVYALGYQLRPVKITNNQPQVVGQEQFLCYPFVDCAAWNNVIFVAGFRSNGMRLLVVSLSDPENPAVVDSMNLGGDIKELRIKGNTLYALHSGTSWSHIVTYQLSAMAPYATMGPKYTLSLVTAARGFDITGSQLIAMIDDTLSRFRIQNNGNLQYMNSFVTSVKYGITDMAAMDTNTICIADGAFFRLYMQSLNSNNVITHTDTMAFRPAFFRSMSKLSDNSMFYTSDHTFLIGNGKNPTGINTINGKNETVTIYPNPTTTGWYIKSNSNGILSLYTEDGRLIRTATINKNVPNSIEATSIVPGIYFYVLRTQDGNIQNGKLCKQ